MSSVGPASSVPTPTSGTVPALTAADVADRGGRLIAVGVRDADRDRAPLAWALAAADPTRDMLYIVHAYQPVKISDCAWPPVTAARDARRERAGLVVARALQQARLAHTGLAVDGSAIAGASVDVLTEFSGVVDLVVVGEDDLTRHRPRTTWRTLQAALCPVVMVSPDYTAPRGDQPVPVTMVVDSLELPGHALEFALAEAARCGCSLRVAQFWSALNEPGPRSPDLVAARQEQFDAQLAGRGESFPLVPVVGELLLDDWGDTAARLREASRLIVVPVGSAHLLDLLSPSTPESCPVAVVGDASGRAAH